MGRIVIEGTARSAASPGEVFAVLRDRPTWPEWSPLGRYTAVSGEEGTLGSVATFTTARINSKEEIVELIPGERLTYALLSGLPLRGYRGQVDLTPDGTGTAIRWRSTFEPKIPGTGWVFRRMLGDLIPKMAAGLAQRAETLATR